MIFICYDPDGIAIADAKAEETVKEAVAKGYSLVVSTFNVVNATRALIARKIIKREDVSFNFQGQDVPMLPNGRFKQPIPSGFGTHTENWLLDIMKTDPR